MSDLHDFGLVMTRKRVIKKFLKKIEGDSSESIRRSPIRRKQVQPEAEEPPAKRKKDDFEMQVLNYMVEQTELVKSIHKKVSTIEKEILLIAQKFAERAESQKPQPVRGPFKTVKDTSVRDSMREKKLSKPPTPKKRSAKSPETVSVKPRPRTPPKSTKKSQASDTTSEFKPRKSPRSRSPTPKPKVKL